MQEELKCPICGKSLQRVSDKKTVYLCEGDVSHKFAKEGDSLLWAPIIEISNDDEVVYFRKYTNGVEVYDATTTENLLSIIYSMNLTLKDMVDEYNSLGEYVKALESKIEAYKAASANSDVTLFGHKVNNTTKSGIILSR